jgi:hypothetical protein
MNNPILSFLTELVVRLRSKSPLFFKILQWISIAVTLITGLPEFLTWAGVQNLPDWFTLLQSKVASIAALVGLFLAGLPVDQPLPTDQPVSNVKEKIDLPFTDQVKK